MFAVSYLLIPNILSGHGLRQMFKISSTWTSV